MKMGLKVKLLLGFLVVNLLLVTVFVVNLVFLNENHTITTDVFHTQQQLSLVQDIDYYGRSADDSGSYYLMSKSSAQRSKELALYNKYVSTVNSDLSQLKSLSTDAQELTDISQFESNWQAYISVDQQAFQLFQSGKTAVATKTYTHNSFEPVIQPLINYTNYEKQSNQRNKTRLATNRASSSTTSLIIMIIALIVGMATAWILSTRIAKSIASVRAVSMKIAAGDLRVDELHTKAKDEIADLMNATNAMVHNLQHLVNNVADMSEQVAAASEELSASAEETTKATNQIANSIQEVATGSEKQTTSTGESARAMEDIATGIQHIAETTTVVSQSSKETTQIADVGSGSIANAAEQMESISHSVEETSSQIRRLDEYSQKIGQIIEAITGIAEQTNLLSLNAAIEAARAGEHGRGFAVVAEEVRKLAEQSAGSAKEITALVHEIQNSTTQSVHAMEQVRQETQSGVAVISEAGKSFAAIVAAARVVSQQIEEVTAASEEMSATTEEVTAAIEDMANISKQANAEAQNVAAASEEQLASMEEISSSATSLSKLAQDLQQTISTFQL